MAKKEKEFSLTSNDFGGKGWALIIFSFLCIVLDSSIMNDSLNVVLGAFAETNGWDVSLLYGFASIAAWIAVAGAALWGFISLKLSARVAWALSLIITAVVCAAWGFAPNEPIYFICLAVANVCGMAFAYIANLNVISNWFPRKKGIAMGLVTIGFPVSVIITVPLLSKLLSVGGLPAVYLCYAAASLVLGIIGLIFIRDYPEQVGAFPDNDKRYDKETAAKNLQEGLEYMKTSQWKPGKLLKTKQSWQIGISLGIAELLSLGIMTNFVPRCLQSGFQMGLIMQMLMISGLLACIGSYIAGVVDAHIGPKKTSVIVLLVGVLAIALNLTNIVPLMFISLAFLGFMLGGASNCLVSITNTIWGRYDFPMAYKVQKPLIAIVGAAGVGLVGIIGHQVSYFAAYIVLAILALIGAFIMSRVDDKLIGRSL